LTTGLEKGAGTGTAADEKYEFIPMAESEMDKYVRMVQPELVYPDFITPDEYDEFVRTHELFRSWVVVERDDPEKWVGWTAAGYPSKYLSTAVEVYGTVVFPPYRGRGLGKLIHTWRSAYFRGKDLIGTVQPTNIVSMNMLISLGYRPYMYDDPWIVFLYRASGAYAGPVGDGR